MNPGMLRNRITILNSQQTPDGIGGVVETWTETDKLWGDFQALRDQEFFQSLELKGQVTHKITIRYSNAVNEASRVIYNNLLLEVKKILPLDNKNQFLQLMCKVKHQNG